jgi:hypothetical protein
MSTLSESVAIDSHTADWIQGSTANGKQVLSAKLPQVLDGSVIDVRASGSARGHFYFRIVETTGQAKDIGDSTRVLMVGDNGWHTIETSTVFQATAFRDLNFAVQLDGVDLPGDHVIFHLTLIAKLL